MSGAPAVRLAGVTKRIGRQAIVRDLDLAVERGEVFGLLGPNGAGKTTTIRLIVGLIAPTAGEILIHGRSVTTDFSAAIAQVGAVVEMPEFYSFLTGRQNLAHFAALSRVGDKERLAEVVALLGMREYIDKKAAAYSLGMRQRLGIAQALLHRPSVLILDEPTNGLDPAGIRELREHLRILAERDGVSVIVSSHLLAEMELICDRIAIIKRGALLDVREAREAGGDSIRFVVDDPGRAIAAIRESFPALAISRGEDTLAVGTDRDTAAGINACLVAAGIKVFAMESRARTLEDIYMDLTAEEDEVERE